MSKYKKISSSKNIYIDDDLADLVDIELHQKMGSKQRTTKSDWKLLACS